MKILSNYRYYVLAGLFTLGLLTLLEALGVPAPGLAFQRWALRAFLFAFLAAAFFAACAYLIDRWGTEGEIPELTNLMKEEGEDEP